MFSPNKSKSIIAGTMTVLMCLAALPALAQRGPQAQGPGPRGPAPEMRAERAAKRAANRAAIAECAREVAGSQMPRPQQRPLLSRFDTLDANDDGFLDADELMAVQQSRIAEMMAQLDDDVDGLLSREEIEAVREARFARNQEMRRCVEEHRASPNAGQE